MAIDEVDEDENLRHWVMRQIEKLRRVAAIGSLALLTINLALSVYPYIEHRNIHPYLGITIVALLIAFGLMIAAHIWNNKLEMYRGEMKARMTYNPFAVYALQPYEEMWNRICFIPIMEYLATGDKEKLSENLEKMQEWVERGYIPKKHFPEHLKKYYITDKEQRL